MIFPPLSQAFTGELTGVVAGPQRHMTDVCCEVIDAIRNHHARRRTGKVVVVHAHFVTRIQLAVAIECAEMLLLLRVDAEHRLTRVKKLLLELRNVLELCVAIRMRSHRQRLVSLPLDETQRLQQLAQNPLSAGVPRSAIRRPISLSDRLVHRTSARIGSPAVCSRNTSSRFCSSSGLVSINRLGPPPFFGPGQAPDPRAAASPHAPAGSFLDHTPKVATHTRLRQTPTSRPQRPRTAADPSPTRTGKTISSAVPSPPGILASRPP